METLSKVCNHCKIEKPLSEFYKAKENRDGRTGGCAQCARDKAKLKKRWQREDVKEYQRIWMYENKEHVAERKKANYEANREEILLKKKLHRAKEETKAQIRAYRKVYAAANKERLAEKSRARNMELPITYVKNKMGYVKDAAIPDALVEAKRLEMLIKRRIRDEDSNTAKR